MANKALQMVTGANAILRLNEHTVMYAMNVSYDIQVQTIPVEPMGMYEVSAYEPIATYVSGSLTVIRRGGSTSNETLFTPRSGETEATSVISTRDPTKGNGLGNMLNKSANTQGNHVFFDPSSILTSQTVDIEVFIKQADSTKPSKLFTKIRDARLEQVSATLSKNNILMETYTFVAELMDGDSYTSSAEFFADLAVE
jgi:hypothetical protein